MELAITNTHFVKKSAHRVSYNSGGRSSQVNYIMLRRQRMKDVVDTKVIVGESVAKQHQRSSQCDNPLDEMEKSTKTSEENKMVQAKRLQSKKNNFKMEVIKSGILGGQEDWQRVAEIIQSIARMEPGETSGKVNTAGRRAMAKKIANE